MGNHKGEQLACSAILKANWERYRSPVVLSCEQIRDAISPFSTERITDMRILPDGCANTNYKILFANKSSVVMRIYTRQASALGRERAIHKILEDKIPTAKLLFCDETAFRLSYPFAIFSYVDGISLRDLIFSGDENAITSCYFDAGRMLALLSEVRFAEGGFFENDLTIRPFSQKDAYFNFAMALLKSPTIKRDFGLELIRRVQKLIDKAQELLPKNTCGFLTHGDFDPSNIMVMKIKDSWQITGILDWEFALASSYFSDIGQMLRYSHFLSQDYTTAFVDGMRHQGLQLSPDWQQRARITDLLSLLKLAHLSPKHVRPNLNNDVKRLITNTVDQWD